jgi:hypothetical protein
MENEKYKQELEVFLTNGGALLSAYILKRVTELILGAVFHKTALKNPEEDESMSWIEAIGWAAFTGALAGILKLIIKRGTKISLG